MFEPVNEIYCEDNIEFMKKLPSNYIDLVVTSPPYDKLRDNKEYNSEFDLDGVISELYRILKDGGVVVWVVGDSCINGSETGTSFRQALAFKDYGFNLHDTMAYEKDCFANPSTKHKRYHQIFEFMFVFSKGTPKTFNPIKDKPNKCQYTFGKNRRQQNGKMKFQSAKGRERLKLEPYGMRNNLWKYNTGYGNSTKDKEAYDHPAIFPEKLAEDHIISWSNENDLVFDPFSGSGTTCKMSKVNRRNWLGVDSSEEYCNIAKNRINNANIREYEETNIRIKASKTKDLMEI